MSDWSRDLRHAIRALVRAPGFTLLAVATLGLALGVNAGIFSVVRAVLLDPLPFSDTDRLVYIAGSAPGSDFPPEFTLAAEFFVHYRERSELLEQVATYNSFTNTLRVDERIERVRMSAPASSLFATLGVEPLLGRLPVAADEDGVAVISHALWTTWFANDPAILERTVNVFGRDLTVIAVMGPDFWFPNEGTLLWIPQHIRAEEIEPGRFGQPLVARLAPGADREALGAELEVLARQLPERFGGSANYARLIGQHRPVIRPLEEQLLGAISGPLWILLGAVAIVLAIACGNVANLLMVRAERQQADLAVRRALGAGRGRLIRARLAEAAVIAALGGVLAVAVAGLGTPLLLRAADADVPRMGDAALESTTLLFTFGLVAFATLLCGLAPALRFSNPSLSQLREGGRGTIRRRRWGQHSLVAAQAALALVLLIGSGLLLRSYAALREVDPGYDLEDLFTFQIAPEGPHLQDAVAYARFHMGFMQRVAALPGVERVGIVENVPLDEGVRSFRVRTEAQAGDPDAGTLVSYTWSAGDYFRTMGIELFAGRTFTDRDHTTELGNVLVSRSAAALLWPGAEAVGQRLQLRDQAAWETVVGVVDDVRQYNFHQPPEPMVYLPLLGQDPENRAVISSPAYVVRTPRAGEIAPEIRALVREVAPTAPMYRTYTMAGLAAGSMARLSFLTLTIGIASALALILGVVGLYGVLSYAVAERSREIGLRMALGAAAGRVRGMIVGQGMRMLLVGVAIGLAIALLATRVLESQLFGVAAFDAVVYLSVSALMVAIGLAASFVPAWRASKVDPMVSLRDE